MAFDWIRFFDEHRIEYNATGFNTSKDNVAIRCPFCDRDQDLPEYRYLSVSTVGKGFRCFRMRTEHVGVKPTRLIQALLKCPWDEAEAIAGTRRFDDLSDFDKLLAPAVEKVRRLRMPAEFKEFRGQHSGIPYTNYLRGRGFPQPRRGLERYGLRYCTTGPFRGRIIFPVYADKQLVTWTGRTISKRIDLRYKTLTTDEEKAREEGTPVAVGPISNYLLWQDSLIHDDSRELDTFYLCEGPFDALKIDYLGRLHGIRASCFFTSSPSDRQIELLHDIAPRFRRKFLLLDQGTFSTSVQIEVALRALGFQSLFLPAGSKDPGEFSSLAELRALDPH